MLDRLQKLETDFEACKETVEGRLMMGDDRMDEISATLHCVKDELEMLRASIDDLLEIIKAMKGFAQVMGWFGRFSRWIALVLAPITALIGALIWLKHFLTR